MQSYNNIKAVTRFKQLLFDEFKQSAMDNVGIWINDETKFSNLKSVLSFEFDKNNTDIRIIPNSEKTKFTITAATLHDMLFGFGFYIREIAHGHFSWCEDRIPETWIIPAKEYTIKPNSKYTVAYNYCTLSYTMAFWDKDSWEKELIRLAMFGFNMALLGVGIAAIWSKTLKELKYDEDKIKTFIPDEAAQAWWNMGNLETNDGTLLSDERIAYDGELGKWIVKKMRSLGIEPIFQGFVGLVPSDLGSSISDDSPIYGVKDYIIPYVETWQGYTRPSVLNISAKMPSSDVTFYQVIADIWFKNLKEVYGTTVARYIGGDLFHEASSAPGGLDPASCAKQVQAIQQKHFHGVKWVMQMWQINNPQKNIFKAVDSDKAILLALNQDMHSNGINCPGSVGYGGNLDKTGFENVPWVFCEVLNFGGNIGMYGGYGLLSSIATEAIPYHNSLSGFGLLSEGLETNPFIYDMYTYLFYSDFNNPASSLSVATNVEQYIHNYSLDRYGIDDSNIVKAFEESIKTTGIYNINRKQQGTNECLFCAKPGTGINCVYWWSTQGANIYFDTQLNKNMLSYMFQAGEDHPELWNIETYRFDICDIARQILADRSYTLIYNKSSYTADEQSEILTDIDLMNDLLECQKDFRLDYKENRTRSVAGDDGVAGYRRMITSWGKYNNTTAVNQLHDYAHRTYAGLLKKYYRKRWEMYFAGTMTDSALQELNKEFLTMDLEMQDYDAVKSNLKTKVEYIKNNF